MAKRKRIYCIITDQKGPFAEQPPMLLLFPDTITLRKGMREFTQRGMEFKTAKLSIDLMLKLKVTENNFGFRLFPRDFFRKDNLRSRWKRMYADYLKRMDPETKERLARESAKWDEFNSAIEGIVRPKGIISQAEGEDEGLPPEK